MGTNYYLHDKPPCPTCGHTDGEPLHIGKSSMGWCFGLHVIPEEGINSLDDWRSRWNRPGAHIENEYGEPISGEEMNAVITNRRRDPPWDGAWWGVCGYGSEAEFHLRNNSERGPSGMLRHAVDGRHCVGHGDGTWDLITGEFG